MSNEFPGCDKCFFCKSSVENDMNTFYCMLAFVLRKNITGVETPTPFEKVIFYRLAMSLKIEFEYGEAELNWPILNIDGIKKCEGFTTHDEMRDIKNKIAQKKEKK